MLVRHCFEVRRLLFCVTLLTSTATSAQSTGCFSAAGEATAAAALVAAGAAGALLVALLQHCAPARFRLFRRPRTLRNV